MKKHLLPITAAAAGAAALILRLLQNRTGFEADTGLPIPGAPAGIALVLWLAAAAAALAVQLRALPRETGDGPAFPAAFHAESTLPFTLVIAGLFLIAASGGLELFVSLSGEPVLFASGLTLSARGQIVMGALSLMAAAALLPAAAACRRGNDAFQGALLLVPPVCLVARLVLVYRLDSVNPALEAYYVELLALVFLTLAFYRLSSFAYRAGRTRRFLLYAGMAVVLSMAAVGDGRGLAGALLYAGGALSLLGFMSLRLTAPET